MLNTFMVYVENKPGVLTRVASLVSPPRLQYRFADGGAHGEAGSFAHDHYRRCRSRPGPRIEANLYKLVNVLLVENITNQPAIVRDLAMIRVAAAHEARSHVLELASVFRARVVDVRSESLTIEITGAEDKIDGLLEVLRPYGILEMVRTGIVAMRRGSKSDFVFEADEETTCCGRFEVPANALAAKKHLAVAIESFLTSKIS
jgi:acetolactate synthase I/III small subunit